MPISTTELMKAVALVVQNENVKVAAKKSAQGAVIAATATAIGGTLFGPIGLALGGTIGGITAMLTQGNSTNSFSYQTCR